VESNRVPQIFHFLEKLNVSRASRLICVRIVKFDRSIWLVEIIAGLGLPITARFSQPMQTAGLYLHSGFGFSAYCLMSIA
jgi:hypothetical protein